MKDLYALLGVGKDATPEELKRAWRDRARRLHPDVNPEDPDATRKFGELSAAYEVLADPERRRQYDTYGPDAASAFFDETLARRAREPVVINGEDVHHEVWLSPAEAQRGGRKDVTVEEPVECPTCHGTGWRRAGRACSKCEGGKIGGKGPYAVLIPRMARDGQVLRIPKEGERGSGKGAQPGDLVLTLRVRPHFARDGSTTGVQVPIDAKLREEGGEVEVPLPRGGTRRIKLPPGVKPGQQVRLAGLGVGQGDLIAVLVDRPPEQIVQAMKIIGGQI